MSEANYRRGHFVWHELFSPDLEASKKFYGALLGWSFKESPMPGEDGVYTEIRKGEQSMGGFLPLSILGRDDVPPHWIPYVSIANIDESAAAATANGGSTPMEPKDIEGVGRFVTIGDPQHGYSCCINLVTGDPPAAERPGVGEFCWDQLNTTDVEGAGAFYAKVYGWEKKPFPHGGDMSVFHAGETSVASVMQAPEGVPTHWITYVVVENLAKSREQVAELGGQVMMPAIDIPNVGTIGVIADPTGAVIGLFEAPSAG